MLFADKYELQERIGEGAMGTVYRARHVQLDLTFAIKVLHPQYAADPVFRARFLREARVALTFVHKRSVTLRDFGLADNETLYLTMDFCPGLALSALLREVGPLPARRAIQIALQVLEVLQEAHAAAILHRDIKPDNIMVDSQHDQDQVKVLDFGVARLMELDRAEAELTRGYAIGTPLYMSPEQAAGETMDARSDLYSLGVVLFEMLTGRPPFTAPTVQAILMKHLTQPPPPLPRERGIDDALEALLRRMLAKTPDERAPHAAALRQELQAWLEASTRSPLPPPLLDAPTRLLTPRGHYPPPLATQELQASLSEVARGEPAQASLTADLTLDEDAAVMDSLSGLSPAQLSRSENLSDSHGFPGAQISPARDRDTGRLPRSLFAASSSPPEAAPKPAPSAPRASEPGPGTLLVPRAPEPPALEPSSPKGQPAAAPRPPVHPEGLALPVRKPSSVDADAPTLDVVGAGTASAGRLDPVSPDAIPAPFSFGGLEEDATPPPIVLGAEKANGGLEPVVPARPLESDQVGGSAVEADQRPAEAPSPSAASAELESDASGGEGLASPPPAALTDFPQLSSPDAELESSLEPSTPGQAQPPALAEEPAQPAGADLPSPEEQAPDPSTAATEGETPRGVSALPEPTPAGREALSLPPPGETVPRVGQADAVTSLEILGAVAAPAVPSSPFDHVPTSERLRRQEGRQSPAMARYESSRTERIDPEVLARISGELDPEIRQRLMPSRGAGKLPTPASPLPQPPSAGAARGEATGSSSGAPTAGSAETRPEANGVTAEGSAPAVPIIRPEDREESVTYSPPTGERLFRTLARGAAVLLLLLLGLSVGLYVHLARGGVMPSALAVALQAHPAWMNRLASLPGLEGLPLASPAETPSSATPLPTPALTPVPSPKAAAGTAPKVTPKPKARKTASNPIISSGAGRPVILDLDAIHGPVWVNRTEVRLEGAIPGGGSTAQIPGHRVFVGDGKFSGALSLQEGPNEVTVIGFGPQGSETAVVRIDVDTRPPQVTVVTPEEGETILRRRVELLVQVQDAAVKRVTVNGQTLSGQDGLYARPLMLRAGQDQVNVVAEDMAGNRTQVTRTIRHEGALPRGPLIRTRE